MSRFIRLLKSRRFRRMLTPWLILLIALVILLSGIFYSFQYSSMQRKWREQAERSTQSASEFFHLFKSQAENSALLVQFSQSYSSITQSSNDVAQQASAAYEYMYYLNLVREGCDVLSSIWVYDREGGYVYTSERSRYAADSAWMEGLLAVPSENMWAYPRSVRRVSNNAAVSSEIYLTYIASIWGNGRRSPSYVYMNVSADQVYRRLIEVTGLDRVIIVDHENRIVLHPDPARIGEQAEAAYRSDEYFTACMETEGFRFYGFLSMEDSRVEHSVQLGYNLMLIFVVLTIFLILCGLISQNIYNPLEELIEKYEKNAQAGGNENQEMVQKSLENLARKTDNGFRWENQDQNAEQLNALMQDQLTPLMLEKLDAVSHYVIVTMEIDCFELGGSETRQLASYFERLVRSFLRNLMEAGERVYTLYVNSSMIAAVICLKEEKTAQDADRLMKSVQEMLRTVSTCTVSMACSDIHDGKEKLSQAFSEALRAQRFKMLKSPGCRLFYSPEMDTPSGFSLPDLEMRKLFNTLDQQDEEAVRAHFRGFIEDVRESRADVDDMNMVFYLLLGQIIQMQMRRGIPSKQLFREPESSPYRYLTRLEFADSITDWLEEKLALLCSMNPEKATGGSVYINAFQKYMADHYMEDLTPEDVSAAIGISYSYLRKLLSNELDTSFSAYLLNLRLAHTRELLLNTNMVQKEIAEKVGFGSEQTLYRVFRQCEGCSPGEWRREHSILNRQQNNTK